MPEARARWPTTLRGSSHDVRKSCYILGHIKRKSTIEIHYHPQTLLSMPMMLKCPSKSSFMLLYKRDAHVSRQRNPFKKIELERLTHSRLKIQPRFV